MPGAAPRKWRALASPAASPAASPVAPSQDAHPSPLEVMQVLAIDLGTDMLPAIALGTERPEPGTMARPPRPRDERLLSPRVLSRAYGFIGLFEAGAALTGYFAAFLLGGWRPGSALPSTGTTYVQATTMTQTGTVSSSSRSPRSSRSRPRSSTCRG